MKRRVVRLAAAFGAAVLLLASCTSGEDRFTMPVVRSGASVSPSADAWKPIATAPAPARQEIAAATLSNLVFIAGGLVEGGGATSEVAVYDSVLNVWSSVQELPVEIHHAMATALGEQLVVMGGIRADGRPSDRVFMLDGGRWQEAAQLSRPRAAGAAVTLGSEIVLVGGTTSTGHAGPVEIFDGTAWRDGAAIPSLRDHIGAATDGKLVYVAGGRRAGGHFATFEAYDPAADRWTKLPEMPTARSGNGTAFVNGSIISAGGEGPRMFPEVEAYDIEKGIWSRLPDLAVPVHGVGLAAVGSNVYSLVGGIEVGLKPTRVCQVIAIR